MIKSIYTFSNATPFQINIKILMSVSMHLNLYHDIITVFCPGYLEWWLDSNLYILVLFIQYMHVLNTVSVPYTCII